VTVDNNAKLEKKMKKEKNGRKKMEEKKIIEKEILEKEILEKEILEKKKEEKKIEEKKILEKKEEERKKIEKYLSTPRLRPYSVACGNNLEKALELYQLNMRLASSFLPLLSILEVSLRNAIDTKFREFFKTERWFTDLEALLIRKSAEKITELTIKIGIPPKGYKDNEPLNSTAKMIKSMRNKLIRNHENNIRNGVKIYLRKFDWFKKKNVFEQLEKIETEFQEKLKKEKLKNEEDIIGHSQIIADANFGFWTSFFKEDLFNCLNTNRIHILNIYVNKGIKDNRENISFYLEEIRRFRNRVAHNEPLFFKEQKFNLEDVKKVNYYIVSERKQLNK